MHHPFSFGVASPSGRTGDGFSFHLLLLTFDCLVVIGFGSQLKSREAEKGLFVAAALRVTMNGMVTGLIIFPLVKARKTISNAFPDQRPSRMYSDVAAIVIKAATPLSLFVAITWEDFRLCKEGQREALVYVFGSLYAAFSALSPHMMIFRVTTGRSWQTTEDSDGGAAAFSQPINFARTGSGMSEINMIIRT
ncbi:hypothetical protein BKA70DRAFT_1219483 [Coprinopsis sp. MPI-PUGE-AT-0042]|nr:hypothetical protein BKA70DRAFT_1219483 [Coprinopsis sp. MPI-PUGE-AT-0042]